MKWEYIYIFLKTCVFAKVGLSLSAINDELNLSDEENVTKYLEATYIKKAANSCHKYQFGMMHDCTNEINRYPQTLNKIASCKNYTAENPTTIVADFGGRLGNQIWAYVFTLAVQLKYEYDVYATRHCHDILASYFENLSLKVAEEHLCGFEKDYYTYREKQYTDKAKKIVKLIQDSAGIGVAIKKSPLGQFVIPPEISRKNPGFQQKIRSVENSKPNYEFRNATYPWEVYTGSLANLGIDSFRLSRALILEDAHLDKEFFDILLVTKLVKVIDKTFQFKADLLMKARDTLTYVAAQHNKKQKMLMGTSGWKIKKFANNEGHLEEIKGPRRYHKGKSMTTSQVGTTFVGIHSRRGDHIQYERKKHEIVLTADYFLDAMDLYRAKFHDVVFIYISDDLDWGKRNIIKRAKLRNIDIYLATDKLKDDERSHDRNSIGHDLALMSLCNHTILSHGTFSFWAGYFAGGMVVRPEHFRNFRSQYANYSLFKKHPLDNPLPKLYKQIDIPYISVM